VIKRLARRTGSKIVLEQFQPAQDFRNQKATISSPFTAWWDRAKPEEKTRRVAERVFFFQLMR